MSFRSSENLNCLLFRSLSPCVYFLFEQMQVFHTHYFGRTFPKPTVLLVDTGVYFYIIDSRQVDAVSARIDSPAYIDRRVVIAVDFIVRIAVAEFVKNEIGSRTALVNGILGQTCTCKRQRISGPKRILRL